MDRPVDRAVAYASIAQAMAKRVAGEEGAVATDETEDATGQQRIAD